MYLNRCLAPHVTRHGVLVDVYGVGVLLTGESGVGKSEAALELVKRGHQLVADDVVDICRVADDRLIGEAPEMVRHFMEIRGIGIIDIRAMYGVGSVIISKSIDMVIHMEKWDQTKEYDRLGLTEETVTILGVKVPYQIMPVRPGRNLAIIIEVASRNLSLKRLGYSAAHELDRRLNEMIAQNRSSDDHA
jgi:HPr kinase/phosphorylase